MELRSVEAIVGALNAAGGRRIWWALRNSAAWSREFNRLMNARLLLREKIQWLEDMEILHERFEQDRIKRLREDKDGRAADS